MNTMTDNTLTVHLNPEHAAMSALSSERTITARFRNPARSATVNIGAYAWTQMESVVPEGTYRSILDAALTEAAKSILSSVVNDHLAKTGGSIPVSLPASLWAVEEILDAAMNSGSEWLSKDELTAAWKTSATYKAIYSPEKYASNKAYRVAFTRFEELIVKLAGKTSQFDDKDLDVILAKLAEADHQTQFGRFVLGRITAIKNKPQKDAIDLADLL